MALLTIEQAAKELGVKPKTLRDWRSKQRLGREAPPLRFTPIGKLIRIDPRDLAEFIENCREARTEIRTTVTLRGLPSATVDER